MEKKIKKKELLLPVHNKSTAFTHEERKKFELEGLLPPTIETIEIQLQRVKNQMSKLTQDIDRYTYLANLQNINETLFYKTIIEDPATFLKIIYDPTVGEACLNFSHLFQSSRGIYLTKYHKGNIEKILKNWPIKEIRFIVVTDGSRILGLGDLGANGMGIPIGKLALYTAVGAIPPAALLPIFIDFGTNNITYLNDSLYLGLKEPRTEGKEYNDFMDEFIATVHTIFPHCCVQFEDFANYHAIPLLKKYQKDYCMFNDDIQGTAGVTVAAFYAANKILKKRMSDHTILFLGAGSAAHGIADLLCLAMEEEGTKKENTQKKCWMFDTKGLVHKNRSRLEEFKQIYAHDINSDFDLTSFLACIKKIKPTAIVGVSTCPKLFTKEILAEMAKINEQPIILPLSNPTSQEECSAEDAYNYTNGKALFAAGVKFDDVIFNKKTYYPTQANNLWIFPAIGMAVYATKSKKVTEKMFLIAAKALSELVSEERLQSGALFPDDKDIIIITSKVAAAVALFIFDNNFATVKRPDYDDHIIHLIEKTAYHPFYRDYTKEK